MGDPTANPHHPGSVPRKRASLQTELPSPPMVPLTRRGTMPNRVPGAGVPVFREASEPSAEKASQPDTETKQRRAKRPIAWKEVGTVASETGQEGDGPAACGAGTRVRFPTGGHCVQAHRFSPVSERER